MTSSMARPESSCGDLSRHPSVDGILGVRASGYYRHDPGFVTDIGVGGEGIGRDNDKGGRLAVLYKPTADLSVRLSAMVQENRQIGLSVVDTDTVTLSTELWVLRSAALRARRSSRTKTHACTAPDQLPLRAVRPGFRHGLLDFTHRDQRRHAVVLGLRAGAGVAAKPGQVSVTTIPTS